MSDCLYNILASDSRLAMFMRDAYAWYTGSMDEGCSVSLYSYRGSLLAIRSVVGNIFSSEALDIGSIEQCIGHPISRQCCHSVDVWVRGMVIDFILGDQPVRNLRRIDNGSYVRIRDTLAGLGVSNADSMEIGNLGYIAMAGSAGELNEFVDLLGWMINRGIIEPCEVVTVGDVETTARLGILDKAIIAASPQRAAWLRMVTAAQQTPASSDDEYSVVELHMSI